MSWDGEQLRKDGIDPAYLYYADRILAGLTDMPSKPDTELTRTIHYIQEHNVAEKKGRKSAAPAEVIGPEFVGKTPPALAAQELIVNAAAANYGEERDLVNQLLGQAQMADAFAKFSVTVTTSKLAFVKENKLYRALAGKQTGNGYQFEGTWDEFCGTLGMSREKADLDITNLRTFGEEALDSMSKMGIGYRELRQYRKLPEDKRLALIEVAKSGDKDSLLDLAEDFIAENTKKSDELTARVADLEGTVQAQDRLIADKNAKLDTLATKKGRVKTESPDEIIADLRRELMGFAHAVEAEMAGKLLPACRAIIDHHTTHGGDSTEIMEGVMLQVERMAASVRAECGLIGNVIG